MTAGKPAMSTSIFELSGKAYTAIGGTDTTVVNGQLPKKDLWEYNPQSDARAIKPQVGGPVRWVPVSLVLTERAMWEWARGLWCR
jgi:hypothetical protein